MDVDSGRRMDGCVELVPLRGTLPVQRHQRRRLAQSGQGQTGGNSFFYFLYFGVSSFFLINTRWTASLGRPWFGFMASNGSCREFFGFVEFPFDFILFFFARLFWSTCSVQSSSRLMPLQGARGCVGLIRWHSSLARRRQWDWRWLLCINTRRLCYKSPASR